MNFQLLKEIIASLQTRYFHIYYLLVCCCFMVKYFIVIHNQCDIRHNIFEIQIIDRSAQHYCRQMFPVRNGAVSKYFRLPLVNFAAIHCSTYKACLASRETHSLRYKSNVFLLQYLALLDLAARFIVVVFSLPFTPVVFELGSYLESERESRFSIAV